MHILGTPVDGLLDSGASISIISSVDLIKRWNLKIENISLKVRTANGESLKYLGIVYIPYTFDNKTKVVPTVVIPDISKGLICGYDFWTAFDIRLTNENGSNIPLCSPSVRAATQASDIKSTDTEQNGDNMVFTIEMGNDTDDDETGTPIDESLDIPFLETPEEVTITPENIVTEHQLTPEEKNELVNIINMFPRSCDGAIGRTTLIQHTIELIPEIKPKKIPAYKYSPKVEQEVDKEVERLLRMDAIEECVSDFVNPILPVKKANGSWETLFGRQEAQPNVKER